MLQSGQTARQRASWLHTGAPTQRSVLISATIHPLILQMHSAWFTCFSSAPHDKTVWRHFQIISQISGLSVRTECFAEFRFFHTHAVVVKRSVLDDHSVIFGDIQWLVRCGRDTLLLPFPSAMVATDTCNLLQVCSWSEEMDATISVYLPISRGYCPFCLALQ